MIVRFDILKRLFAAFLCVIAFAWNAHAAIAFVAASDLGNNGGTTTSLTVSYTVGGSSTLLVCGMAGDVASLSDKFVSATYNGAGSTGVVRSAGGGSATSRWDYLIYWLSPATGANNVVITVSSTSYIITGCADYSGVGSFDTSTTAHASNTVAPTMTVGTNAWPIMVSSGYNANNPPTAGSGTTRRTTDAAFGTYGLFDSNAAVTGSTSLTANQTTNDLIGVMASFLPTGGSSTVTCTRMMQGVGPC